MRLTEDVICGLVCLSTLVAPASGLEPPSAKQLRERVRELDDDRFAVREAATRNLVTAGKVAVEPVTAAAASWSLEVTERAVRALKELSFARDPATAAAA